MGNKKPSIICFEYLGEFGAVVKILVQKLIGVKCLYFFRQLSVIFVCNDCHLRLPIMDHSFPAASPCAKVVFSMGR